MAAIASTWFGSSSSVRSSSPISRRSANTEVMLLAVEPHHLAQVAEDGEVGVCALRRRARRPVGEGLASLEVLLAGIARSGILAGDALAHGLRGQIGRALLRGRGGEGERDDEGRNQRRDGPVHRLHGR